MTEAASLLDINDNPPPVGAHTDAYAKRASASAYFRPVFRILATTTFVISLVTIILLITTFIILKKAPLETSYLLPWNAQHATKPLAITLAAPLVISGISALINVPILLNVVVDIVLLACIIPREIDFVGGLPDSKWCRPYMYPGQPSVPSPDPKCLSWKSVIAILMQIGAGFTLIICIIYVVQLFLRGLAIYRTKLWKRPLCWALPSEIDIHFTMRVRRQEGESAEGSEHGPVYLS